jgi:hypothetical protein
VRWPWRKHARPSEAATQAVAEAREHLREAQTIRPQAREVAESLRELREHNHFGEAVESIFRGRA